MDREGLMVVCNRVLREHEGLADVVVVALALQRYLVGEQRQTATDRRAYQRDYMRGYRLGKRRRVKARRER